tara:strand:- start:460 stop:735 length:276 start_codon:yes stop_codon:yes gene_type:complete
MNIADRYAALKNEIDALTKELDKCKAEIKATGKEEIVGDFAIVTLSLSERTTLDTKLVKDILSAEQIAACSKVTLVETLRVKANVKLTVVA